jgi:Flp pilus assembly protein protease CpaA
MVGVELVRELAFESLSSWVGSSGFASNNLVSTGLVSTGVANTEHTAPLVTITLAMVGMIVLAGCDVWRREVEDYATIAFLAVVVVGMDLEGLSSSQWVGGVLAAAIAFTFYLGLGQKGVVGGGDVKLSIIPALVLGASNPVIGLWWVACAVLIHQLFFYVNTRVQKEPAAIPHVPAMAAAVLVSVVAFPMAG